MQTTFNRILIATTIAWQLALPVQAVAQSSSLPAGTVATVNGTPITDAEVNAVLQASKQPDTPQVRQAIKNQLIARVLIQQAAEKAKYDGKPEVQAAMQAAKANAETQLYLKDNIKPAPVTDAQVKARYDEIVGSLGKQELKTSIIVAQDAATAATVLGQLKAGQTFEVLARQYSQAPSAAAGGELPWVSFKMPLTEGNTLGLPLSVAQAMTALPAGGVTPESIPLGNGARAIVKVDAKRPTQVPTYEAAQPTIRQQLQALAFEKATAELVGGLMKGAKIQQQ
ncbi:peptidyl-prolyl cis-trans isomerase [Burkholderia cenocepacia]|uniref:peptidylprolyl isomerase n=1 Tax=Burkholderia cenocepacia TaxID=95486 RepID=UPI0020A0D9E9|nr:peptidyl-prolyl cis-trans isomerase [Burkholderia cenocepacia]MCO8421385.1 peptidyl-prolyl cis-trans isomerase [Burkholderia cenocepacia]MCO8471081.1 peptidyl-prolyl cis-trans isomerase [Burkholderia cenocepacia]MCO8476411.1 peptidyl-prolyl cis-trans isomerase [Burkholderia cenocepacia]MCO8486638.1 peptidyl-prolyl cis-trans isomerase [Burkholderia cenocepacia]MCO8502478.1 peptidyl-prolyl cis-trans isomerase [Burkholderia cenocepacia]